MTQSDSRPARPLRGAGARDRGSADRLIEAAELLFGRHGLDGISMRQVQLAAGSSNKFAVQYHFGDAAGLVQAVLVRRMPAVDARQADLFRNLERCRQADDMRALIGAFLQPLLEEVNALGERSYARFIVALLQSPDGARHCKALFHLTPTTPRIVDALRTANPAVPPGLLDERLRLITVMVCTSVFNRLPTLGLSDAELIADVLDVAAAGLAAVQPTRGD